MVPYARMAPKEEVLVRYPETCKKRFPIFFPITFVTADTLALSLARIKEESYDVTVAQTMRQDTATEHMC